jgi:hypothetical protein
MVGKAERGPAAIEAIKKHQSHLRGHLAHLRKQAIDVDLAHVEIPTLWVFTGGKSTSRASVTSRVEDASHD